MQRLLKTTFAALMFFVTSPAHAVVQTDVTLDQLGVVNNVAYLSIVGSFAITCPYGLVYIDLTSIGVRSVYALLTAAKLTGTPLSAISYALQSKPVEPTQSLCYLYQANVQG